MLAVAAFVTHAVTLFYNLQDADKVGSTFLYIIIL